MKLFMGTIASVAAMILSGSLLVACSHIKNEAGTGPSSVTASSISSTSTAVPLKSLDSTWTPQYNQLAAYYHFIGTPNSTIANNTNLGSVIGPNAIYSDSGGVAPAVGYTAAPTNQGISFDGNSNYMTLQGANSSLSMASTQNFTFMTWVKWSGTDEWARIIANGDNSSGAGWSVRLSPNDNGTSHVGSIYFGIGSSTGLDIDAVHLYSTSTFNDGQWHLLTVVANQTAHQISMYVNASQVSLGLMSGTCGTVIAGKAVDYTACTNADATAPFWLESSISGWGASSYTSIIGSLSEIAVFSTALTASEISTIYLRQK